MKKLYKRLTLPLVILLMIGPLKINGQNITVKGKVTTYDSIPVIRAEVKARGTGMKVLTDSLGQFIIECLKDDKLVFKAGGFKKERREVTEEDNFVEINMEFRGGDRNLELAIGPNGHIREKDRKIINSLNDEAVDFSRYSTIYDALRGRVAGVNIIGDNVYIRGQTNIISGDDEALLVVDGVVVSKAAFSTVSTSDIRRIRVLKGSAAAIYGARGGNGVVEVETKRGK